MLSFPSNPISGQQYTDSNGKVWSFDGVKWNISTSESIKQFYGTKISILNPVFLTSTLNSIEFDTEDYDTLNGYDLNSPTQIVIPRTGYYRVHLTIQTGQEGFGASYRMQLNKNSITLVDELMSAYQNAVYDETLLLNAGDVIQLKSSEEESVGTLEAGTILEVVLIGYTFGAPITPGFEFSGLKVELQNDVSVSSTPSPITWTSSDIVYNVNANAAGGVYWTVSNPSRFYISTSAYYRIKAFFLTDSNGSTDSFTLLVRKNGSDTIETISLGPNESAELDETYYFMSGDYIEAIISNSENVGNIKALDTSFSITRFGV
jgi:hypothetical protein